ncbi:glycosyltransferase [Eubacterium oxidoreducens]|uniref:Glycosyltransferase involved in cell wall bisynthesis n=1 Tax=Eubacterium oxidoreducens TaxID=1732 RepID=A0A1G6AED8_EUBOX|nr:glycosyltransferase [Eubacterium oxidoreducens]SDB06771.1 Glycosyltransferase involved in cell wall bisynthesis [Eubacterium oxidoreducens]
MKKVLFVIESLAGGGAEKILTTIVKNLDKTKYDVSVLTIVKTGIYVKQVEEACNLLYILEDYETMTSPLKKMQYKSAYKKIYHADPQKVYEKYITDDYDVEIAFVEGFATKLVAASNRPSKKYAWLHIDMIENAHADTHYQNLKEHQNAYHKYDGIYAVSDFVRQQFIRKFGDDYPVEVQFNPVDSEEIIKKAQEPIEVVRRKPVEFITVGRLVEQKGYDRLAAVTLRLKEEGYDFVIRILGQGPMEDELKNYISRNELEDYIELLGFKKNPYPYMKMADAFVCSSRSEGFSTVATEALILEKMILTTECSGMRELFGECECGIIEENSKEGIYRMIKAYLDQKPDFEKIQKELTVRKEAFDLRVRMEELGQIL